MKESSLKNMSLSVILRKWLDIKETEMEKWFSALKEKVIENKYHALSIHIENWGNQRNTYFWRLLAFLLWYLGSRIWLFIIYCCSGQLCRSWPSASDDSQPIYQDIPRFLLHYSSTQVWLRSSNKTYVFIYLGDSVLWQKFWSAYNQFLY